YVRGVAGREPAVGRERDAILVDVIHRLLDALRDDVWCIHDFAATVHAPETNVHATRELAQAARIARGRNRKLHHELIDVELLESEEDRIVGALPHPAAPAFVPTTEVQPLLHTRRVAEAFEDAVYERHAVHRFRICILVFCTHLWIDEQAQVRIV